MMIKKSLNLKLILFIIAGFAFTGITVVILANRDVKKIIDKQQAELRQEQIHQILDIIDKKHSLLEKKGLLEAMGEQAQASLLKELSNAFYNNRNKMGITEPDKNKVVPADKLLVYPFIVNDKGIMLMHPTIEKGSKEVQDHEFVKNMLQKKEGSFHYKFKGQDKWLTFHDFDGGENWKWQIAYALSHDIKYSDAYNIRNLLIMIIFGTSLFTVLILFYVLRRYVSSPIKLLTQCASEASDGNLDMSGLNQVELARLNKRQDEIGLVMKSFNEMLETQQRKTKLANAISQGDLTQEIVLASNKDALGKALQYMQHNLSNLVQQVRDTGDKVSSGSLTISGSSQSLSQGATQQAASLEEITSSMTEIGSQTKQNADNAQQANQLAVNARGAAEKGNEQMSSMVEAMGDIQSSSEEITKIIKTIDDIAFQTNLLALNAAVEAARAGRHGKGFAVVAEEVRNLAARSAKAAQETANLIESSNNKVENGTRIANATAEALGEIVEGITKSADLVGEIAAASNEQAQGVSQVSQGLGQIDSVTQQNTANAEETASAAQELLNEANILQKLLARFKLNTNSMQQQNTIQHEALPEPVSQPKPAGNSRLGWVSENTGQKPQNESSAASEQQATPPGDAINPEQQIKLDDNEFGKF